MVRLHVLRVFLEGRDVPEHDRQRIAADLGFSETVFVEDPSRGELRIFTPTTEQPFAGHPLVGTAWLLAHEGAGTSILRPPAGEVPMRTEGDFTYISGQPEWAPPFEHVELDSPAAVDELTGPPGGHDLVGAWAWEDEEAGRMRARVFPVRLGIKEDEATGAHAVRLCARLGRAVEIHQGKGSLILARPQADGTVESAGRSNSSRKESTRCRLSLSVVQSVSRSARRS